MISTGGPCLFQVRRGEGTPVYYDIFVEKKKGMHFFEITIFNKIPLFKCKKCEKIQEEYIDEETNFCFDCLEEKNKPTVACIEWMDPLMIAGNWIPEMVEIAGGKNILGKSGNDSHWIKIEELINKDPDIIIFLPCGFNIKKTQGELKLILKKNDGWKKLKAFKNNKFFVADGNQFFNRPGPRLIESLEIFAEIIHPKIYNFKHEGAGWIKYYD